MIIRELKKEIEALEDLRKQIRLKQGDGVGDSDAGQVHAKLICKRKKSYYQYYVDDKYVSKKKAMKKLQLLAEKEYRDKLLPMIEKELVHLKNSLNGLQRMESTYSQMHEGKQILFKPEIVPISGKIQAFSNETYERLAFSENDRTEYYTHRGERVRSKSEKIIADELFRHGIPYHYEKPVLLRVDGQVKELHPDFTAMDITTGEVKYLEHLGLLDNPNYYGNVLAKLDAYERNGLLIGRDVLLLHESAYRPINTRIISDYICEFLM